MSVKQLQDIQRPVVLFDLDGTLLPMDYDTFEARYFDGLCRHINDLPPRELVACIWAGTKAMVLNDGSRTNREVFAEEFSRVSGLDYYENEDRFMQYYLTDFQNCKEICTLTNMSFQIVDALQQKGYLVAIATNPLFPSVATYSRLRWLGIAPERFPLVTTFENSGTAKPNPDYYLEVCSKLNVSPENCIMIGNDVGEDGAAAKTGMEVAIVTDCLINKKDLPMDNFAVCTLQDVYDWAKNLPRYACCYSNQYIQSVPV